MGNDNTNAPTPIDYDHINLILKESEKHGLRWEVEKGAEKYIRENPKMDIVSAYTHSYNDWVK